MLRTNPHYARMGKSYLFAEIAHRVEAFRKAHPGTGVISMGIGDVTQPLVPSVIRALHAAVDDMGSPDAFHGYGPEQGYAFLREAVALEYAARGVSISPDDIFHQRRRKVRSRQLSGAVRPGREHSRHRPRLSGLCGLQLHGGPWRNMDGTRLERYPLLPCTAETALRPYLQKKRRTSSISARPTTPPEPRWIAQAWANGYDTPGAAAC